MGANVIITEVDPIRALKAVMDGYQVMPMKQAARLGDIFVTATGNKNIITEEHFPLLKNGAILGNVGHFNVEVRVDQLEEYASGKEEIKYGVTRYRLPNGRHLYLLAEGRLFNLAIAEGHPSEVMDLSFANQILSLIMLVKEHEHLENKVYNVPRSQDELIALMKLDMMGVNIEKLTEEQTKYMRSWEREHNLTGAHYSEMKWRKN